MPTYSPEQAGAHRPRAAVGRRAAGRHAVAAGRSVYSDWPDAGRRWPFSEGWALAQFTLGGGLLLLALSYRYWRARGARAACRQVAGAAAGAVCCLGRADRQNCRAAGTILSRAPQALIEVLHDDWPRLPDSLLHHGLLGCVLLGTSSGFITGLAIGWSQRIGYWVHPVLRLLGPVPSTALLLLPVYFSSSFGASVFLIALSTGSRSRC